MSKQSTSHLTVSRKTRCRAARPDVAWWDILDDHCHNLATLAGLLAASDETLDPDLASSTGYLLDREIRQMQAALAAAWKEAR